MYTGRTTSKSSLIEEIEKATTKTVNNINKNGETLLRCLAGDKDLCEEKGEELLEILCSKGANIDAQRENCRTALAAAVRAGNVKFAFLLLSKKANPLLTFKTYDNCPGGFTAIHTAISRGYYDLAEEMLKRANELRGFDINDIESDDHWTLLHDAVNSPMKSEDKENKIKFIELLVETYGAKISIQAGKSGRTTLSDALNNAIVADGKDADACNDAWEMFFHLLNLCSDQVAALSCEVSFDRQPAKLIWQHAIDNVGKLLNIQIKLAMQAIQTSFQRVGQGDRLDAYVEKTQNSEAKNLLTPLPSAPPLIKFSPPPSPPSSPSTPLYPSLATITYSSNVSQTVFGASTATNLPPTPSSLNDNDEKEEAENDDFCLVDDDDENKNGNSIPMQNLGKGNGK